MKKRIISMALVLMAVTSMFAADVSAADPVTPGPSWVRQTYESNDSSYLTANGGNLVVNLVTEEDGNKCAEVVPATDKPFLRVDMSSPVSNDFVLMVDLCKMSSPSLGWQFHVYTASDGQYRWAYNANEMEEGVWYTYMVIRKDGVARHYRKVRGSDDAFESITVSNSLQISDGSNCLNVTMWTPYGAEVDATYATTKFLVDNLSFYNGSYAVPGSAEITVSDADGGKTITASVEVMSDAELDSSKTVAPVMVIFDKKGKIMEWCPKTEEVKSGSNRVANEVTLTSDYYEKVKGGTAELYLWTTESSFKPMMNGDRVTLD